ncbi:MAG: hypothetical protein KA746_08695 [Pyrinomonadaceae bacterium]|nr:hypothetical protein [Pyrinomonadaceae bacterium]MBP6213748.1 hypothetical protein [Pyrinomonadaceae bacterium]
MLQRITFIAFLTIFAIAAQAQTATDTKKAEAAEKLTKEAVEFLRETSLDVGTMRSIENRISFGAEIASLMWFSDEKEARSMYGAVISDFKQLLSQYDAQLSSPQVPGEDDEMGGMFLGGGRSPVERKFRIALAVRQQIAMSLAEHEPEMAYAFFYDCISLITNDVKRKELEASDKYFEFQLINQIAATNATKATRFGIDSLKNGVESQHIELLRRIYAKDPDKGVDFGAAILSRLKSGRSKMTSSYLYSSLLSFGKDNLEASTKTGGKKAIYSQNDLRDIADQFAQFLLESEDEDSSPLNWVEQIEKFAPARAVQLRAKFKQPNMPKTVNAATNTAVSIGSGTASANTMSVRDDQESEARAKAEREVMENVASLSTKPLPKEERDKIVAQARKIISQTPGKEKKITALSMLAAQVARAGDKELAGEIMRDAERMVNPQPKNYRDFLLSWMLISGYAESDPEKAFPMLEEVILKANDTLTAFVKVAEFIDTASEIVDDGEVQVGAFGGSMISGLTKELGLANSTIMSLARADFAKTRALTNRFDRTEIRVLAKMMVLRVILDDKEAVAGSEDVDEPEVYSSPSAPRAVPARPRPN